MVSKDNFSRLFYWNVFIRLSLIIFLTSVVFFLSGKAGYISFAPSLLFKVVILSFIISFIYVLWHISGLFHSILLWTQIIVDILIASLAVYWSGGESSPFTFLFVVIIIGSCLMSGRLEGSIVLVLSIIGYAIALGLSIQPDTVLAEVALTFFVNMAAFSLTAFVGLYLSRRLHLLDESLEQSKANLRRMKKINRYIADSLVIGLLTVDEKGMLLSFNQAAENILDKKLDTVLGKPFTNIFSDNLLLHTRLNNGSRLNHFEIEYDTKQGKKILSLSLFFLSDEKNNIIANGITFEDITNKKEKDERIKRQDRLAALGEMAAGLAHEIRNPLASLSGAAQLLKEETFKNPYSKKLVNIMDREAWRLNELTSSFLDYALPAAGKKEKVNINNEFKELFVLLGQKKEYSSAIFETNIPKNLDLNINLGQFRQVVLNLLTNAVQSLPTQGGVISIKALEKDEKIVLKISDTGKGIKETDISRIFNPFFTTRPDGVGLGLSIVHQTVLSWGGDIQVASQPGKGTEFTVIIPV
jgi:two-component system sensor histidine kinase PilS (NtrC family)